MFPSRPNLIAFLLCASFAGGIGCGSDRSDGGGGGSKTPDSSPTPTPDTGPTPIPAACQPTAGGPHWILEGETLHVTLSCATGAAAEGGFAVDPLPAGAAFDAGTSTLAWTPALDAAAVYHLDLRVAGTGETGRVTIGVADRWEDPSNVPVLDASKYTEEFGLPVFFLSPAPVSDDEYAPTTIVYRGHTYIAEAKKRGVTSLSYPKNSYTLRFDREDKFDDEDRGFDGVRRLALTQTFDDNSYMRNRLAFTLWNRLDPNHVQVKCYSAVVYLDGEYWGLYTVTDHIDDSLMKDNGLGEDGNMFKAITHEANWDTTYAGAQKWALRQGFVKTEGLPEHGTSGAYTDLERLVAFVGTASNATFYAELDDRIETRDYMHWWIFARMIHAEDSASKNSFHYHPVGGKWRYIPWDFNASFGQSYATVRRSPSTSNDFTHRNKIFARMLANADRRAQIDTLYREALDGPWKLDDLLAIVDAFDAEIAVSARRDERKWRNAYRSYPPWSARTDFTDFDGEVDYLRAWLIDRWELENASH